MTKIVWPAVIQYEGDDELSFVANEKQWRDEHSEQALFCGNDQLIDSNGHVFSLACSLDPVTALPSKQVCLVNVDQFTWILKAHLASLGQCCVAKVYIKSVEEGVESLA